MSCFSSKKIGLLSSDKYWTGFGRKDRSKGVQTKCLGPIVSEVHWTCVVYVRIKVLKTESIRVVEYKFPVGKHYETYVHYTEIFHPISELFPVPVKLNSLLVFYV